MNDNARQNAFGQENEHDEEFDFDALETKLESDLEESLSDLDDLITERDEIGNPETIGSAVLNSVWDQIVLQIGAVAGEDFIKENRGLTLDLSKDAHIQTTENFANGKIATHNTEIDYQKRYDEWQANFQRNEDGSIRTKMDARTGAEKPVLRVKDQKKDPEGKNYNTNHDARAFIDDGRPTGSKSVNKDHTISAAEIIRDPEAAAHMTREDQAAFANSDVNLLDLDASANQSKQDSTMTDWLESERDGKKPAERFNIDEEELRERDRQAREEYERRKKEAEQKSIEAGKKSRRQETFRIGGKALRSAVMVLLAELARDILHKFISWLRSGQKTIKTFIEQMKAAITEFVKSLKKNLMTAGEALITTIAFAIWGPIVDTIKKVWMFLKQGYRSIKEAIAYLRNPANKNKSASIVALEIGKIIVAGAAAAGTLVLGEMIEVGLLSIPIFTFQIPLFGTLANILGMFLGALISGILGALVLNFIDRLIAKSKERENRGKTIEKQGEILATQGALIAVENAKLENTKHQIHDSIKQRHAEAANIISDSLKVIFSDDVPSVTHGDNSAALDELQRLIDLDDDGL